MNNECQLTKTNNVRKRKAVNNLESKKRQAREEKKTMSKAQEVHYFSDFKAADRALERARGHRS